MDRMAVRLVGTAQPELVAWSSAWLHLRTRLDRATADERGMTTETVIITAGLAALAVALVGIIGSRVRDRASSIP